MLRFLTAISLTIMLLWTSLSPVYAAPTNNLKTTVNKNKQKVDNNQNNKKSTNKKSTSSGKKKKKQKVSRAKKIVSRKKPVSRGPVAPMQNVERLLGVALSLRGTPYRYTGTTPKGFDCSGFTRYAFKSVGIELPHSSEAQSNMGTQISKEQLVPGALVYFNTNGSGVSHVGIYLGKGQFVHSSSGSGEVVVSGLNQGYYSERYLGATVVK